MSYKFIPIENETLLLLMQLSEENNIDIDLLLNAAVNCLNVYFDNEIVNTIVDDYYREDGD